MMFLEVKEVRGQGLKVYLVDTGGLNILGISLYLANFVTWIALLMEKNGMLKLLGSNRAITERNDPKELRNFEAKMEELIFFSDFYQVLNCISIMLNMIRIFVYFKVIPKLCV
jgi:hypothetical protein